MSIGKMKVSNPQVLITSIIGFVVVAILLANLLPEIQGAMNNISAVPGLSFASFFSSGGIVGIILGASVVLLFIGFFGFGGGKR